MKQSNTSVESPSRRAAHDASREGNRAERVNRIVQDLRVVFRTVQAHSRWVEKQCGVSGAQLWAMWELFASPGLKVSE
ncbi:MAG: hypothetical protein AMJ69_03215, partial [Gammaproteobacteria bacterium SG8_47]